MSHTLRINLTHKFDRRACRSLTALQTRCTHPTCQNGTSADFSSLQNWSSEDFPYGGTVAVQETLFTHGKNGNHCSRVEVTVRPRKNHRSQWKNVVYPCSTSFPRHFITFKQASLATNIMTRRCRVFASPFLRLLSLKGYAELFRSAAHLLLSNQVFSVLAHESCVYRFLPSCNNKLR